ncbi:MAG: molybdate ABC transporter substrate-binding protein [Gemmatimonadetes bacterium]|nr:molybdate ABC transporter substrate-binding protein [Gemmatimonadota bacterium]MSR35016.1 molybdate ABC transporter substrate-binding protein [Gemmatimonadota bacterium]
MRRTSVATVLAVVFAACEAPPESGTLSVYAASSLTDAFSELETTFEAAHPDIDVSVTYAGSQILRLQIEQGAPADVFASANPEHMEALVDSGLVAESRVFVQNELVIIVPLDNPAGIESLEDLPEASRLVIGTANVPVGRYTRDVLRLAAPSLGEGFEAIVLSRVASEESNVRLARAKVELGEADAAIVYRSDAGSSDRVRVIAIPSEFNVIADYPIGVLRRTTVPATAGAWVDLLMSPEGRAVLARHGFIVE